MNYNGKWVLISSEFNSDDFVLTTTSTNGWIVNVPAGFDPALPTTLTTDCGKKKYI